MCNLQDRKSRGKNEGISQLLAIGGTEGFRQVSSGSVLAGGRAYVGLYREGEGVTEKLSWGGEGRNFVVAMDAASPCAVGVISTEGQPLTHEEPSVRRPITVLSRIDIGNCPR